MLDYPNLAYVQGNDRVVQLGCGMLVHCATRTVARTVRMELYTQALQPKFENALSSSHHPSACVLAVLTWRRKYGYTFQNTSALFRLFRRWHKHS